jgi:uncharacterized membrane protein/predicted transcriptional regulator
MDTDDAADLLGELPAAERERLMQLMEPGEAAPVRRLLHYGDNTAGGLMTSEPIILTPDATIAEALARVRNPDVSAALATQVYVCRAPSQTPTGRYLGVAHVQRLLREPPGALVSGVVDDDLKPVRPETELSQLTRYLATYDLVAAAVVDEADRLVGAVTVDDVLDHLLPEDWRERTSMAEPREARLDQPKGVRRTGPRYDTEAFGRFAETIARFIGTARFLVLQTAVVIAWVVWNIVMPPSVRFDEFPFIFLTLALSLQAAYAAPLILLAQNRQTDRDRINLDDDRSRTERTQEDIEYLARELAAVRIAIGEVATRTSCARSWATTWNRSARRPSAEAQPASARASSSATAQPPTGTASDSGSSLRSSRPSWSSSAGPSRLVTCSWMPARWVGAASRSRASPFSVSTVNVPRASDGQDSRATSPSLDSRSTSRVSPERDSSTRSARSVIRSRRCGDSASCRSTSYDGSGSMCRSARSCSICRVMLACARRKVRQTDSSRAERAGRTCSW